MSIQIYEHVAADQLGNLARLILAWSERDRSFPSKNVGGWKSAETLFLIDNATIRAVQGEIAEYVYSFCGNVGKVGPSGHREWDGVMHAWAMVNRKTAEHPRHQHYRTQITGIYYVADGLSDEDRARDVTPTPTIFEASDRDITRAEIGADGEIPGVLVDRAKHELSIAPLPGRLVLFPGSIWHRVPKVVGERPRITVAFDVRP